MSIDTNQSAIEGAQIMSEVGHTLDHEARLKLALAAKAYLEDENNRNPLNASIMEIQALYIEIISKMTEVIKNLNEIQGR